MVQLGGGDAASRFARAQRKSGFHHAEQGEQDDGPGLQDHGDGVKRRKPRAAKLEIPGEAMDGGEAVEGEAEAGRGGDDSRQHGDQAALEREAGGDQENRAEQARQAKGLGQARPGPAQPPRNIDGARGEPEIDGEQHDLRGGDPRRGADNGEPFHSFRADFARDRREARGELVERRREMLHDGGHGRLEAMIIDEQERDAGAGDQNRQKNDGLQHFAGRDEARVGGPAARGGQRRLDHGR